MLALPSGLPRGNSTGGTSGRQLGKPDPTGPDGPLLELKIISINASSPRSDAGVAMPALSWSGVKLVKSIIGVLADMVRGDGRGLTGGQTIAIGSGFTGNKSINSSAVTPRRKPKADWSGMESSKQNSKAGISVATVNDKGASPLVHSTEQSRAEGVGARSLWGLCAACMHGSVPSRWLQELGSGPRNRTSDGASPPPRRICDYGDPFRMPTYGGCCEACKKAAKIYTHYKDSDLDPSTCPA